MKTVAIIGAGPVGLAAAAHAVERGLQPIVFEAGPSVAHAVREWGHVRMFSPWGYNIDQAAQSLLAQVGWNRPDPDSYPTGNELVDQYLEPLARHTVLKRHIKTSVRVVGVSRVGFNKAKTKGREAAPFQLRYINRAGLRDLAADAVIDASGTWSSPNPAGASGLKAIGEADLVSRIAYGMPDVLGLQRARYAGKTVVVLGAGHSAIGTLIDLVRLKKEAPGTDVIWLLRGNSPEKAFGGGANDKLSARGELGSTFAHLVRSGQLQVETNHAVSHLSEVDGQLWIGTGANSGSRHIVADELIAATGFRPDFAFLGELRLALDPALDCSSALGPLIDPNEHSCGTVRPHGARELAHPEPGFYIAGMKSYGRAPTFLMLTGYEQVRSIMAEIVGDLEAARRVELELPETGVCSAAPPNLESSECCGGPAKAAASACCAADEQAKAVGAAGCGCDSVEEAQPREAACCA